VRIADPCQRGFIRFETIEQLIARDLEMQRFLMTLLGVFAFFSLALATVGMYGLVAYTASQRTREVGIRVALGATPPRVLRRFLVEGLCLSVLGLLIGLTGAGLASRLLTAFVFGIEPLDPVTFASVSAVLMLVTSVAMLVPALQVSRTDPMRALRLE
jgi:ABC-type antimicrobial peptide transport system permease subunit